LFKTNKTKTPTVQKIDTVRRPDLPIYSGYSNLWAALGIHQNNRIFFFLLWQNLAHSNRMG